MTYHVYLGTAKIEILFKKENCDATILRKRCIHYITITQT